MLSSSGTFPARPDNLVSSKYIAKKLGTIVNIQTACGVRNPTSRWHAGAPKFHYTDLIDSASAAEAFASMRHFCTAAEPSWSLCSMHAHENDQAPSCISVGFLCSSCGQFCACEGAPALPLSEVPSPVQARSEELTQVPFSW